MSHGVWWIVVCPFDSDQALSIAAWISESRFEMYPCGIRFAVGWSKHRPGSHSFEDGERVSLTGLPHSLQRGALIFAVSLCITW